MTCKMNLGTEVFFLTHGEDTYMLRPYHREGYDVSYAAYKQTDNGFEKVCCFDCKSDDYPEEMFAALQWNMNTNCDWMWREAEEAWNKDF